MRTKAQTEARPDLDPAQAVRAQKPIEQSFPASHKVMREVEHQGTRLLIPERRIHLAGRRAAARRLRHLGTAGVRSARRLPKLRARGPARACARGGHELLADALRAARPITEEMASSPLAKASRGVRSQRGRARPRYHPCEHHHPELEPMIIAATPGQDQRQHRQQRVPRRSRREVEKLSWSTRWARTRDGSLERAAIST